MVVALCFQYLGIKPSALTMLTKRCVFSSGTTPRDVDGAATCYCSNKLCFLLFMEAFHCNDWTATGTGRDFFISSKNILCCQRIRLID